MNYYSDSPEWKWLVENAIDWDTIIPLYYPSFPTEEGFESAEEVKDFIKELLSSTGEWTASSVADRAAALDRNGAGEVKDGRTIPGKELSELYREAKELDVIGISAPQKYGGLGVPVSVQMMVLTQLSKACLSSCSQIAFFSSIADMVHRFCDEETAERLVPQIISGELSGSMNLTEPGCGSDLGMIKTTATPQEDGTYLLNGSKIFITNGGGGLGFVLAKVKGAPDNLDGLSLFFTEQDIEKDGEKILNYRIEKNEEKMGLHGSFTTEVVYDNSVARMVGKEGEGFKQMLHLMNEARIAVGLQAVGNIEAAIDYAKKYAEEREQFGKPLTKLPLMRRNLEDFETERDALRALLVDTMSHFDIFQHLELKKNKTNDLTEEEEKKYQEAKMWTRKRTPLVKYYACEANTSLTQKAIQVLGGYGFMQEYPVERLHRDSFGPLLYEGTSQIQALMALKDVVKYAMKDPRKFFSSVFYKHPASSLIDRGNAWSKEFKGTHYRFKRKMIRLLIKCLKPETKKILDFKSWANEEHVDDLMIHAETLCQALSYIETLRVLCDHANRDSARADLFHRYHRLVTPRLEAIYHDWDIR